MKKWIAILCVMVLCRVFDLSAAVNRQIVATNIDTAYTIQESIDLVLTATANPLSGTIDIQNTDAAVIFQNIRPSDVIKSYLGKITYKGKALKKDANCTVSVYRHGCIVLPHSDTYLGDRTPFYPLTVYLGDSCTGSGKSFNGGLRMSSLATWDNAIRSFTLKRGFMVTMANHKDGTGYSHCFIANKGDIEVQLPPEMAGRVSFLRIFRWQWPAKKGVSDLNSDANIALTRSSWFYTWGAGENTRTDAEFVPQRHHESGYDYTKTTYHEAWPSWTEINGRDATCTHILGNNEPNNTGSVNENYIEPEKLIEQHKYYLFSGMRIGTFACTNPNTDWINRYLKLCKERNMRVDFVVTHYYIGGQSPASVINSLKSLHDVSGLPVWVTEWNNGANWTSESGFSTDSKGWYSWGSGNDQLYNGYWLTDVLKRADKEHWIERFAVYNAVESKRYVVENGSLTAGGKLYADYQSAMAYSDENESFMKWNYYAPSDLTVSKLEDGQLSFTWNNENTDCTDFSVLEEYLDGVWTALDTVPMSDRVQQSLTIKDPSAENNSVRSFRILNYDADGKQRKSTIAELNPGGKSLLGERYIRNVATGLFLTGGNNYGTQASLGKHGIDWTVTRVNEQYFNLDSKIQSETGKHYLNVDATVYVDASAADLLIKEVQEGIFSILSKTGKRLASKDGTTVVSYQILPATDPHAQWQFITKEELMAELAKADEENPADATFLIRCPDFSRNDTRLSAWQGEPVIGGEQSNYCAEKWNTNLDVSQQITGMPKGKYILKAQGFYRMGGGNNSAALAAANHGKGTEALNAYLYAGTSNTPLVSIINGAGKAGSLGENTNYGHVPNTMSTASAYFSKGAYENSLTFTCSTGKVTIGVKKTKLLTNDWTIFDNFELYYLGNPSSLDEVEVHADIVDVYDLLGRKIRDKAPASTAMEGLSPGIYIIGNKKYVKR